MSKRYHEEYAKPGTLPCNVMIEQDLPIYSSPIGSSCLDFGVLVSNCPEGEYNLKAVATFDETINDGSDDYTACDYISVYNFVARKTREGAFAPSLLVDKSIF